MTTLTKTPVWTEIAVRGLESAQCHLVRQGHSHDSLCRFSRLGQCVAAPGASDHSPLSPPGPSALFSQHPSDASLLKSPPVPRV